MPTPAITFGRMLGFLRFGPRSWGGDDSRQHPLTPPRVKLPSPPTPKQSQQRAERQLLALCWGLEGLIVVLVSQQAKTFPVLLFKLASFPHRTLPLSSGDRCDIPNRGRRIHQRQRSAGAAKWPASGFLAREKRPREIAGTLDYAPPSTTHRRNSPYPRLGILSPHP
ncbi:uncharacterized protein LOC109279056 isoform X10 [Panthera pardus]|uniref:Uncharacterized protein LOC109279056 isoform X10 n=1 Tax=Panthera pardus TaxID=9691 RepID=A0A9V1GMJ0_PANPR|nr:uncharacterized protein LOC109279056 isoform X10 [Panthera pardus]